MSHRFIKKLCSVVIGIVLGLVSFSCRVNTKNKNDGETSNSIERKVSEFMSTYYDDSKVIDSTVFLSFLGFKLEAPVQRNLKIVEQTTITNVHACEYQTTSILNLKGSSYPVTINLLTVNDTIWQVFGKIQRDCFDDLVSTYTAKYGYPSYGKLEDSYKEDTHTSFHWKFRNQKIEISRNTVQKLDMDSRPISTYYAFKDILIWYTAEHWRNRYYNARNEQKAYDKKLKPYRDSLEAIKKKAQKDSLNSIKLKESLKDAHQI